MDFGDALDARNAVAFKQELQDHLGFLDRQVHALKRLLLRFSEGFRAGLAAEALKPVAVPSEALAFGTAVVARHSGLELSSGQSDNGRGVRNPALDFGLRLNPAGSSNYSPGLVSSARPQRDRRSKSFSRPLKSWLPRSLDMVNLAFLMQSADYLVDGGHGISLIKVDAASKQLISDFRMSKKPLGIISKQLTDRICDARVGTAPCSHVCRKRGKTPDSLFQLGNLQVYRGALRLEEFESILGRLKPSGVVKSHA
jgi:hypothetical protein